MSLKGNLEPSFLAGLFQIFCDEKKTGLFKADFDDTMMEFYIEKGVIVHATCIQGTCRLSNLLVRRGVLSADQVEQAAAEVARTEKTLGRALLDLGICEQKKLVTIIESLAQDLLLELFQQTTGEFDYQDMPLDPDKLLMVQINIRRAILETFRLLDELQVLKRRLPSEEMLFDMGDNSGPQNSVAVDAVAWQLLAMVHGKRRIKEMIRESTYNSHTVYNALIGLMDSGMISPSSNWEDDIHAMEPAEKEATPQSGAGEKEKPKEKGLLRFFKKK